MIKAAGLVPAHTADVLHAGFKSCLGEGVKVKGPTEKIFPQRSRLCN